MVNGSKERPWSAEEIRAFNEVFPDSLASRVLSMIVDSELRMWMEILTNINASDVSVRQAQGGMEALGRLNARIDALCSMNADETENEEDVEEETDADTNVVY